MPLVLYRKYRPKTFSEIIGQEHVVKTLMNSIIIGKISHAYLFSGPRGSGKTTVARIFAKAVNCQNRKEGEAEPCNQCSSCQEINSGRAVDLIEIDAASHRGIDEIRELRNNTKILPVRSKYKIFIIDEAHQLTKEAANALLKTLEEPPPHVIFILATTEIQKMIPTILSRCQRFEFKRLTVKEIIKKLKMICEKEKVKIEQKALELIAIHAAGSLRDAESLLDQALNLGLEEGIIKAEKVEEILGIVDIELLTKFVDILISKDAPRAIDFINKAIQRGVDINEFTKNLINYLRGILITKIVGTLSEIENFLNIELTQEAIKKMEEQSKKITFEEIKRLLDLIVDANTKMKFSPIAQLPLELAIFEFSQKTDKM
jgi:DNA polymerase-3 subunit gamma/tau